MRVWIITWESPNILMSDDDRIAAFLSGRTSSKRVLEIVELIYANKKYSLKERFNYARTRSKNPYPAYFDLVDGVTWRGRIYCGHNPYLYARYVDNVDIERDEEGKEKISWRELSTDYLAQIRDAMRIDKLRDNETG